MTCVRHAWLPFTRGKASDPQSLISASAELGGRQASLPRDQLQVRLGGSFTCSAWRDRGPCRWAARGSQNPERRVEPGSAPSLSLGTVSTACRMARQGPCRSSSPLDRVSRMRSSPSFAYLHGIQNAHVVCHRFYFPGYRWRLGSSVRVIGVLGVLGEKVGWLG